MRRILACLPLLALLLMSPAVAADGGATITVQGGPGQAIPSRSGLLVGVWPEGKPDVATIAALHPGLIRVGKADLYPRVHQAGAQMEIVVSEAWGYPPNHYRGRNVPPYQALDDWRAVVRQMAEQNKGRPGLRWDVWNESNWPPFFAGTAQDFYATYLAAYQELRRVLGPDAIIGGPSIWRYDLEFLKGFLDFCAQAGCQVNFLSWHENSAPPEDPAIIARHAQAVRALANRPEYRAVAVREIEVNEVTSKDDQLFPASALVDLQQLEQGGVDLAARSCWIDKAGQNTCFNASQDGLLVASTSQPNAIWWAHKYYGDSLHGRLPSQSSDPRIVAFASRKGHGLEVLLGYWRARDNAPRAVTLDVSAALAGLKQARIRIQTIPASDGEAMGEPAILSTSLADPAKPIALPPMAVNGAVLVTILPP